MTDERFDYPKHRFKISRDMSGYAVSLLMSEGNKNCYDLLCFCWQTDPNIVLHLDSMNMRGAQVWAAFTGYCNRFFPEFKECVLSRKPEMIDYVNLKVPQYQAVADKSR